MILPGIYRTTRNRSLWCAQTYANGKITYLGTFKTAYEAALAHDDGMRRYKHDRSTLNFPDKVRIDCYIACQGGVVVATISSGTITSIVDYFYPRLSLDVEVPGNTQA